MINVLKTGLYTSIQDLGRFGYRNFGVPIAGVMDQYHGNLANKLLGNDVNAAVMEITLQGPTLQFEASTQIILTGADLTAKLNKAHVKRNTLINISKDDILEFGARKQGVRAYLAVKKGFQTENVLGSRSFYEEITSDIRIHKGQQLLINSFTEKNKSHVKMRVYEELFEASEIEVYKGPEFDKLSQKQQGSLLNTDFTIGINNRMAYQLEDKLENRLDSIITSGVLPGTIQLTPSGSMIILMRDCQTTGGYPRILQLSAMGINILSQKMRGEKISFKMISTL